MSSLKSFSICFHRNDYVCELVGTFKTMANNGRQVYKRYVEGGIGSYNYQLFADERFIVYLECDKKDDSSQLNHSCNPNAEIVEMFADGYRVLMIKALRSIKEKEEVTVRYSHVFGFKEPFKCKCGHCDGDDIGKYVLKPVDVRNVSKRFEDARAEMVKYGQAPKGVNGYEFYGKMMETKEYEIAKLKQVIENSVSSLPSSSNDARDQRYGVILTKICKLIIILQNNEASEGKGRSN